MQKPNCVGYLYRFMLEYLYKHQNELRGVKWRRRFTPFWNMSCYLKYSISSTCVVIGCSKGGGGGGAYLGLFFYPYQIFLFLADE